MLNWLRRDTVATKRDEGKPCVYRCGGLPSSKSDMRIPVRRVPPTEAENTLKIKHRRQVHCNPHATKSGPLSEDTGNNWMPNENFEFGCQKSLYLSAKECWSHKRVGLIIQPYVDESLALSLHPAAA